MKILIASQHFYPENFRVNEIAKSLLNCGHYVDVLTGKPNYPAGKLFYGYKLRGVVIETWSGIRVHRVPIIPRGNSSAIRLVANYISYVFSGTFFGFLALRKREYDVVFCYATSPFLQVIPALLIAKIKKAKLVVNVQDLWPDSLLATGYITNRFVLKLVEKVIVRLYLSSDLLLTQSKEFESRIKKVAPIANTKYWPNSVDQIFLKNPTIELPQTEVFENEKFNIVVAGNIGEAQAVEVILEMALILKEYKNIQIIILGQGSRWLWLKDKISQNNLNNISLLGAYPIETMPSFMRKASALLVTLADQDIFSATIPNRVQAYLASGKPILAAINGEGATVISTAGAGFVVPAGNSLLLAQAAIKLSKMSMLELNIFGKNGQKYFMKHFNHDQLIRDLIQAFIEIKK
jgi:glycosyltransferase involved in cell wall biosynthesis